MAPLAEYRKGTGPQQLPQGAASAANKATPSPQQPMDIPVQYATEADHPQLPPDGQNDNLDILTADPHPAYTPPLVNRTGPGVVPTSVVRNLPRLMAAAMDPEAPESLKALYHSIVFELERQRGQ
jgi:hypothetical protein